jgi:hypothetical protein
VISSPNFAKLADKMLGAILNVFSIYTKFPN